MASISQHVPIQRWSLTIGTVGSPFGIRGEMKVRIDTDFPERFMELKRVCLRKTDDTAAIYDVETVRFHKGQALLKIEGCDSIDTADTFRGTQVLIPLENAVKLPDDEFYVHDLLGCVVVAHQGRELGTITDVLRSGANDVYVVNGKYGEVLLPVIKSVVKAVDLKARKISVELMEGLAPAGFDEQTSAEN